MSLSRRRLILSAAAAIAVRGRAAATPVASPETGAMPYLVDAADLAAESDAVQLLALMPSDAFGKGRIAGSIHLDWAELELADTSERSVADWTGRMRELVAVHGLRADRPVVVYDEGSLFAARGWWQLAYLGFDLPRVLDGGLPAWERAGEPVQRGPAGIAPVEAPPLADATIRRELLATKDEVLAALEDPGVVFVDARSGDEYAAGHIPGAVNRPYTENAVMKQPKVYLSPEALREHHVALGIRPEQRVITYCTTGVRGSVAFFSLLLAGFTDVALYVGSWNEWNADLATPKETG